MQGNKYNSGCRSAVKKTWVKVCLWLGLVALLMTLTLGAWKVVENPSSITHLKCLQAVQSISVFVVPVLLVVWLCEQQPVQWLHLDKAPGWKTALWAILTMLLALPGINLLSWLNQQMALPEVLRPIEQLMQQQEEAAAALIELFLADTSLIGICINLIVMAVLPAVGEELTFRGWIQGHLSRRNRHMAVWVSAAVFSFVHFQFYGFVPRMLLGAMFGYVLLWSGSLWTTMLMHMTNNATVVIAYALTKDYTAATEWLDAFGTADTWWVGGVSIIVTSVSLWLYARVQSGAPLLGYHREV